MYSQIVIILPKKDSLLTLVINYQQITTFWFEGVLNTVTALSKSLWNFILLISALPLKKVNFIVTYSYRRQREMVCAYFITTISPRIYFIHIGKKKSFNSASCELFGIVGITRHNQTSFLYSSDSEFRCNTLSPTLICSVPELKESVVGWDCFWSTDRSSEIGSYHKDPWFEG